MIRYVEYSDIKIDRSAVCRQIGYSPDIEPSPRIAELIDEYLENASHLVVPTYWSVIKDIERVNESSAVIEGSIVVDSRVIADLLRLSSKVAFFISTIGPHLENMASKLADDAMIVQSYLLDAIGSCLAESLAGFVECEIASYGSSLGLSISRRFSPGYCDWDISQQEIVFRILRDEELEVEPSGNHLMTPQKSVSGIIGIGTIESEIGDYNPCKTCNKHSCIGRR